MWQLFVKIIAVDAPVHSVIHKSVQSQPALVPQKSDWLYEFSGYFFDFCMLNDFCLSSLSFVMLTSWGRQLNWQFVSFDRMLNIRKSYSRIQRWDAVVSCALFGRSAGGSNIRQSAANFWLYTIVYCVNDSWKPLGFMTQDASRVYQVNNVFFAGKSSTNTLLSLQAPTRFA